MRFCFRARWYDPVTGRWLSNDPIGISGGLNQFVAFGNNPVMFTDAFGLSVSKGYEDLEEAARNAVIEAFAKSMASGKIGWTRVEYGGYIYKWNKQYYYSIKRGTKNSVPLIGTKDIPEEHREKAVAVGTYHTHVQPLKRNEDFSGDDIREMNRLTKLNPEWLFWLGTPQGRIMRWDPMLSRWQRQQQVHGSGYLQEQLKERKCD